MLRYNIDTHTNSVGNDSKDLNGEEENLISKVDIDSFLIKLPQLWNGKVKQSDFIICIEIVLYCGCTFPNILFMKRANTLLVMPWAIAYHEM